MKYVRPQIVLALALTLGFFLTAAPRAFAQGTEVEPNSTCAAPQNLSTTALPHSVAGSLTSPDVDYYRFTATPGSIIRIEMDGVSRGSGTLWDPYLGVFDENCGLLTYNDDYYGSTAQVDFTVPASGAFIVAATSYGDWEFVGTGLYTGTYRLTLEPRRIAEALYGRIVNSDTGAPAPAFTAVSLVRCESPDTCWQTIGWAYTDSQGNFRFDNSGSTLWEPLEAGDYKLSYSSGGFMPGEAGPFTIAEGQSLNVGDLPMDPIPAAGSISGRLVDEVTRQPLSGGSPSFAQIDLIYCQSWGCSLWGSTQVAADGTFRFVGSMYYNLPPTDYYFIASANQYQETISEKFAVAEDEHYNFGDFRVKSQPARINLVQACSSIPSTGGTCNLTMRITNGSPTPLKGEAWGVVNANGTGTPTGTITFQVGSPRTLSLAPGQFVDMPLSVDVPATVQDGAYICVNGFAAQRPHKFNVLGTHPLVCLVKGINGFTRVPEAQKRDAVRRATGQKVGPAQP